MKDALLETRRSEVQTGLAPRALRLLVLTGSYAPDRMGIAPQNTQLCEFLASRGHHISVVTGFPHYPQWRVPRTYRYRLWLHEQYNDVNVHRGYFFIPARQTTVRRILYDTSVGISTGLRALRLADSDVVIAVSPPLQAAMAAAFIAKRRRRPLLLILKDIVPDLAVALGKLRSPLAIRAGRAMERFVYRHADAISVICEGFRQNLARKGVPLGKIALIPDSVDTDFLSPSQPANGFRAAHSFQPSHFLVVHCGNMGAKQKLETVVEAAGHLSASPDIKFLLVGDGCERSSLEERARGKDLRNLLFLPAQPQQALPFVLAAADVLLLSQSVDLTDAAIPSKLLTYMAAGRPIVAAVSEASEAARCIRQANCGLIVEPENPHALAGAVQRLLADRSFAGALGRYGRRFAEQNFRCDSVLKRFEELLLNLARCSTKQQPRM